MPSVFESLIADLPASAYVRRRFPMDLSDVETPSGGWVVIDLRAGWTYRPHPGVDGMFERLVGSRVGDQRWAAHRASRWPRLRLRVSWPRPALHLVMSLLIRWTT